ncbi:MULTISPECIES: hypothetical protein [unclassified Sphingomonas]|uniref:hypothetical protein n=1 Tax=unclassified Sphingomonas TaxID=196159 RepID=UPI00068FD6F2|nr:MULTISPECIES: hypothetical protein [unclassified Sphingomonas]
MTMLPIARLIANFLLNIELTDEGTMHPDDACQILEQAAHDLSLIDKAWLDQLTQAFAEIATEYPDDQAEFVRNIPANFYHSDPDGGGGE